MTTLTETGIFNEDSGANIASGGSSVPVAVEENRDIDFCQAVNEDLLAPLEDQARISADQLLVMIEERRHLGKMSLADADKLKKMSGKSCEELERKARKVRARVGQYSRMVENLPGPINEVARKEADGKKHIHMDRSLQIAWLLDIKFPRDDRQPWREALWVTRIKSHIP